MQKILEKLVEQYAPEPVRNQLVSIRELRKLERNARAEREQAERELLILSDKSSPTPALAVATA